MLTNIALRPTVSTLRQDPANRPNRLGQDLRLTKPGATNGIAGILCAKALCDGDELAMNITLSVDAQVAVRARKAARAMGKSLNQAVRDFLEQLAGR